MAGSQILLLLFSARTRVGAFDYRCVLSSRDPGIYANSNFADPFSGALGFLAGTGSGFAPARLLPSGTTGTERCGTGELMGK